VTQDIDKDMVFQLQTIVVDAVGNGNTAMDRDSYTMGDGSVRKLSEVDCLSYVRDCQPGEEANLLALEKADAQGQPQVLMIARRSIAANEDLTFSFGLNGLLQSPPSAGVWFHRRRSSSARFPRQRVPAPASSGFPAASKAKKRGKDISTPDKPPKPPDDDLMPIERDERADAMVDGGGGQERPRNKTPKGKSRRRQTQDNPRSTSELQKLAEATTMQLRHALVGCIIKWIDSGTIAEVFTTFADQTEPGKVRSAWRDLVFGASSLQCVQWHAFLVERRDFAKGGNVEVILDRVKEALSTIQSFSNGSSPSAEFGCLDAAARSLGISDLSDTAHISHLLDYVSFIRGIRVQENALTRVCLQGTWVTQRFNDALRQLTEDHDAEYRAQLYATAYCAMHEDVLAVDFLLHVSNDARARDIDDMQLAGIDEARSDLIRALPLLQAPVLDSVPEEWHAALRGLWEKPDFLAWAHEHTDEVERLGNSMEGNFQTRITTMIVCCSQEVNRIQDLDSSASDGHTTNFAAFLEALTATLRGEVTYGPSNERDQRAKQALADRAGASQW
jgi:hypothetical protein